ncbi:BRCA2 and CDKN1A-interacting protein [Aphis craccivora]|uniref:BRCA2 and CDKN1A-interacting protein n=1 Tax=Aphis craccivora TaxID=307492 RepID=A0A6G0ZP13_APHCR|nr:BRCA2 and CDKN1A-interacting protein [Aphis craccivora]
MSQPARKRGVLAGGGASTNRDDEASTNRDGETSNDRDGEANTSGNGDGESSTGGDSSPMEIESDSSSSSDSDDNDDIAETVLDVEFEGRSPQTSDFHSIKQLLQQLFLKAPVNLSDLSTVLINQPGIGSVIKQVPNEDEEEDSDSDVDPDDVVDVNQVFGISSVLNISQKTSECVHNLHKLMLDLSNQYSDSETTRFVNGLLGDDTKQVGLLINERYVNIPPPISVPLFHAIRKELFSLKSKDSSYNFDYLIMISKLYKMKKDKKGNKNLEGCEVFWSNAEEEFFDEEADYKFEFCVQNDKGTGLGGHWSEADPEMVPFRRVLIFTMEKFHQITNRLASLLEPAGTVYNSAYKPGSK